jgi:glycosyltransferase involved in cell wall biosynthesis
MKVRIVCYEDVDAWILGKFAKKLNEELSKLGIKTDIAKVPDPTADINHHIIYFTYDGKVNSVDTLMITHIDSSYKLNLLKKQLESAKLGICMSLDTMQKLVAAGIPQNRLYYINPAHDGIIKPRTTIIGITSKVHEDGRKKENLLIDLCKKISPNDFSFKIMGSGWNEIVRKMKELGFNVEYFENFDYDKYIKLMPTLDYFFYFSFDEGSMAFMDALAAGVPTIVTPQGYHLDAPNGISYSINNFEEIIKTFDDILGKRNKLTNAVFDWTWGNYAKEHVVLWSYLMNNKKLDLLLEKKLEKRKMDRPKIEKLFNPLNVFTNFFTFKNAILNATPNSLKRCVKYFLQ